MILGVCTPPCLRKLCICLAKMLNFRFLFSLNSYVFQFWSLHTPLRKNILHLLSYKTLNFRPFLNLNLSLGAYMPALPMKILHFATWKCLISGPVLVLMYKDMIWWGAIDDLKMPNLGPFFSLNVYDFWVLRRGSPLASYLRKFCILWSQNAYFI